MPPIDLRNGGRKTCVSSITLWLPCPALPRPSGFPPRRKLSWASLAPVRPGDVHLGTKKNLKFYRWIWIQILHPLAMETSSEKKSLLPPSIATAD